MNNKINDIVNAVKINELFHKKEEDEKKRNCVIWILAIVGIVAVIAAIAYGVYKFIIPDYYEDDDIDYDEEYLYEDYDK